MSEPLPLGDPARQAGHPGRGGIRRRVLLTWREFDGQRFSAWAMLSQDAGASWGSAAKARRGGAAGRLHLPLLDARQALVVWNARGRRAARAAGGGGAAVMRALAVRALAFAGTTAAAAGELRPSPATA
jgi:hypothetical protein